ncbi:hypothetical protein LWC34_29280 [Kibdelosporangium philippinense]|uniref:Uncharacterized protein n=1 Tax=Kibdelosporangium philippinense TaxID=211113 RepID=A0ABS8ZGD6_9PSEU|nr:hypothetical protein [Kibdelosporangium philippinense]MCE7006889.1 hypothetical protein [Kibdelosporangium philippinense]
MDTIEAKRIEATNYERYQLATGYGWQFWADVPALLDRWQVLPFNQRGDKRLAFGVVQGNYQGMPFTVFDFHRRPVVTSVHTRWTNKKVNELDTITIDSVWVITLPVALPFFQIVGDTEPTFDTEPYPEPPTPDRKFNRWYKMIDTDPNVAMRVLTPPLMAAMRQLKLHNWSLVGNELLYVEHPIFGRTKPDEIVETLGKLAQLVPLLPLHQPAPPAPQPMAPQYPQQQYQQPYPPQHQPYPPQQPPYGYPPQHRY